MHFGIECQCFNMSSDFTVQKFNYLGWKFSRNINVANFIQGGCFLFCFFLSTLRSQGLDESPVKFCTKLSAMSKKELFVSHNCLARYLFNKLPSGKAIIQPNSH